MSSPIHKRIWTAQPAWPDSDKGLMKASRRIVVVVVIAAGRKSSSPLAGGFEVDGFRVTVSAAERPRRRGTGAKLAKWRQWLQLRPRS